MQEQEWSPQDQLQRYYQIYTSTMLEMKRSDEEVDASNMNTEIFSLSSLRNSFLFVVNIKHFYMWQIGIDQQQ